MVPLFLKCNLGSNMLNTYRYFIIIMVVTLNIAVEANGQDLDQTPSVGRRGTPCYDDFNRPQRCIPEFENAAFNVLMEATNTCGDNDEIEFCVQSGVTGIHKSCEFCYANSHRVHFLTDFHSQDQPTWWQSETMHEGIQYPNQVNLTLRLGKAFDITYVRLVFFSPRPESFAIFKKTSENSPIVPYQYYSATCRDTYNLPDSEHTTRGEETRALCTSEYSDISPLRGGNVAFSTLQGRPSAYNFEASPDLQEWVTATDIVISLDRLNTFGDEVFGDPQVLRSYFYAIADVAVGARCKCNGHASECITSVDTDSGTRRRICKCEHSTAGPDCNECLPFYNDAPWGRATAKNANECKQCNCNGFSNRCYYDDELYRSTGHGGHCLDCAANRDGPNCERCRENYYMRDDGYCIACNCDTVGSRSLQCSSEGKCQCKPGVTGDKCDRCAQNYYDFGQLGCKNCGCSDEGSSGNQPNCDPSTGICYCKENVEGKRCRECKPGFFNLDIDNEFGCTPCFCYGHSSQCIPALGYSKYQLESMFAKTSERWRAEDEYQRPIDIQYNALSQSISAKASGEEAVYFLAPNRYLGDQRASYNHLLQFTFRIGDNRPLPTATDVILEGGGAYVTNTIFAQQNRIPSIEEQQYSFRLHENSNYGWQPRLSARAFMSILTNLTALKIRATYAPQGVGYLNDVKLETASRGVAGRAALWVENCECPIGYVGQYCESCAPGYRHSPSLGGSFMPCIPCDCNKHADICDSETGRCICEHNTAGDNCELCGRGYYGNALGGTPIDCLPCGCPNGGACIQVDEDTIMCTECPVGYTGHRCDSCSDGYFGDPTGRFGPSTPCVQCDCNINIDPNAIGNCNTTTGQCLKCIHNTGGPKCSECSPGYYGNALALPKGDCKLCECYPHGTERASGGFPNCDRTTGLCKCKSHVVGRNCDQCEDGFYSLGSEDGCQSCNCNPIGSYNQTCHIYTGQCFCRPGVTGIRCDHCEPYKYGFSSEGCKSCDCDRIGSKDLQCDASGQCPCLDNVEGRQCNRCKENKYDRQRGCIDCPDCYNLILDASRGHSNKLDRLSNILEEVERRPTVIEDADFPQELSNLQEDIDEFHNRVKSSSGNNNIVEQVQTIKNKQKEISRTMSLIDENLYLTNEKINTAEQKIGHANNVLDETDLKLNEVLDNLDAQGQTALEDAWDRAKIVGQQSDKMTRIAHESREFADQFDNEVNELAERAADVKNKSIQAYEIAKNAIDQQKNISEEERLMRSELLNTEIKLNKTKEWTMEVSNRAKEAKKNVLALLNDLNNILIPEIDIPQLKQRRKELMMETQKLENETNAIINKNDEMLKEIEEQLMLGQKLLDYGVEQQDEINDLVNEIHLAKTQADEAVRFGDKILNSTKETYKILNDFDRQVQQNKQEAEEAFKSVNEIEAIINEAFEKTHMAETSLRDAKINANEALDKAQRADDLAKNASLNAANIKNDAEELYQNTKNLNNEAELMAERVSNTENELNTLLDQTRNNDTLINQAKEKVGRAGKYTQDASKKVTDLLINVEDIISELKNLPSIDEKQLDRLEDELKKTEERLDGALLDQKLEELHKQQKSQSDLIDFYKNEISRLQKEVDNIEQISRALPDGCFKRVVLEP